jgi:hypothetical protein
MPVTGRYLTRCPSTSQLFWSRIELAHGHRQSGLVTLEAQMIGYCHKHAVDLKPS